MFLLVSVNTAESLAGEAHTSSLVKSSVLRSITNIHIVDKDRASDRLEVNQMRRLIKVVVKQVCCEGLSMKTTVVLFRMEEVRR